MAPYELKRLTVKQLNDILSAMADPGYLLNIMKASSEEQKESAILQHRVQLMRLRLRNAELSSIRDNLVANEADLTSGIQKMTGTLNNLEKISQILSIVDEFLRITGRIITVI